MPDLDLERLRGRKLFVGTPMYDGKCHSEFAFAIVQLTALCTQLGIDLRFYFACHDALITKARNVTVDEFLKSDNDALIFVDADIGFDARDVLHLLWLQLVGDPDGRYDVVAAPYPLKRLAWDSVLRAAKTGVADEEPDRLARYSSAVAVSPAHQRTFAIDTPVEVTQAGTGFMMIRRDTFARFRDRHPHRSYRTVERVGMAETTSPEIYGYFDTEVDIRHNNLDREIRAFVARRPAASAEDVIAFLDGDEAGGAYSGRYFSEDYAFCRRVRAAGMKVWLCPWMELTHTGSHRFTSRLVDLGSIGAA